MDPGPCLKRVGHPRFVISRLPDRSDGDLFVKRKRRSSALPSSHSPLIDCFRSLMSHPTLWYFGKTRLGFACRSKLQTNAIGRVLAAISRVWSGHCPSLQRSEPRVRRRPYPGCGRAWFDPGPLSFLPRPGDAVFSFCPAAHPRCILQYLRDQAAPHPVTQAPAGTRRPLAAN